MKTHGIVALLALAALLSTQGCGRPKATVTILNDLGSYDIMAVYVYPDSVPLRGTSVLTGPLLPGESAETKVIPGIYNVVAIDEDQDSYHYGGLLIGRNGYEVRVGLDDLNTGVIHSGSGSVPVEITNSLAERSIFYAFASTTAGAYGGEDLLRMTVLAPGETLVFWTVPGTWSFRLEDENGEAYTRENIQVGESGFVWDLTDADTARGF